MREREELGFLPWEVTQFDEMVAHWEPRLRASGVHTEPDIGRKWQAIFAYGMGMLNTPGLGELHHELLRALGAPKHLRGRAEALQVWIREHWHKGHVRWVLGNFIGQFSMRVLREPVVDPAAVAREIADDLRLDDVEGAFLRCLISFEYAKDPDAEAVARQAFGPERWDRLLTRLDAEVRPVLWAAMMDPDIERLRADLAAQGQVRALVRAGRDLSWQAKAKATKHQKASERLATLEQLVAAAQQELAEREQELRAEHERTAQEITALLGSIEEERVVWQELLTATQSVTADAPALPLAGKRVLIVGGDPIATGALALVRALGAARVEACPGFEEERRFAQALEGAEMVIAITAYMAHAHSNLLRAEMDRRELPVVWVNHMGLHALQRAVVEALG